VKGVRILEMDVLMCATNFKCLLLIYDASRLGPTSRELEAAHIICPDWCLIPKYFWFSGPMYVSTMFQSFSKRQGPIFWLGTDRTTAPTIQIYSCFKFAEIILFVQWSGNYVLQNVWINISRYPLQLPWISSFRKKKQLPWNCSSRFPANLMWHIRTCLTRRWTGRWQNKTAKLVHGNNKQVTLPHQMMHAPISIWHVYDISNVAVGSSM
jgi:hypothetical protein